MGVLRWEQYKLWISETVFKQTNKRTLSHHKTTLPSCCSFAVSCKRAWDKLIQICITPLPSTLQRNNLMPYDWARYTFGGHLHVLEERNNATTNKKTKKSDVITYSGKFGTLLHVPQRSGLVRVYALPSARVLPYSNFLQETRAHNAIS